MRASVLVIVVVMAVLSIVFGADAPNLRAKPAKMDFRQTLKNKIEKKFGGNKAKIAAAIQKKSKPESAAIASASAGASNGNSMSMNTGSSYGSNRGWQVMRFVIYYYYYYC